METNDKANGEIIGDEINIMDTIDIADSVGGAGSAGVVAPAPAPAPVVKRGRGRPKKQRPVPPPVADPAAEEPGDEEVAVSLAAATEAPPAPSLPTRPIAPQKRSYVRTAPIPPRTEVVTKSASGEQRSKTVSIPDNAMFISTDAHAIRLANQAGMASYYIVSAEAIAAGAVSRSAFAALRVPQCAGVILDSRAKIMGRIVEHIITRLAEECTATYKVAFFGAIVDISPSMSLHVPTSTVANHRLVSNLLISGPFVPPSPSSSKSMLSDSALGNAILSEWRKHYNFGSRPGSPIKKPLYPIVTSAKDNAVMDCIVTPGGGMSTLMPRLHMLDNVEISTSSLGGLRDSHVYIGTSKEVFASVSRLVAASR